MFAIDAHGSRAGIAHGAARCARLAAAQGRALLQQLDGDQDTEKGHSAFVHWTFVGDLQAFYATMRWPGREAEVERVAGDQALSLYPPPWTVEGKDPTKVSRRPVPAAELWNLQQELAANLRHA